MIESEVNNSMHHESGESTSFKIFIDPFGYFLVDYISNESESVLFDQLDKGLKNRTDLTNLLSILQAING